MVEEQTSKSHLVSILAAIGAIIIIVFLIILKINIPKFPLWQVFLYSIIVIVVAVGIYFFSSYLSKRKKSIQENGSSKVPAAITVEQAREMAIKAIKSPIYADYVGKSCLGEKVFHLGKNIKNNIYCYKCKGLYETNDIYYVLINMNWPNIYRTVLINPKDDKEVLNAMMMLSQNPEEEPSTREIVTRNALTGSEQVIKETIKKEDKTAEDKKKEEDL